MSIADWDPPIDDELSKTAEESSSTETVDDGAIESATTENGTVENGAAVNKKNGNPAKRPLHRLAEVRRQQGLSQRNMARRLGVELSTVCQQEDEMADLPLSVLYLWQRVLDIPVAELLVDSDDPLSPPVLERARMVKLMKTAVAIMEKAQTNSLRRMVTMLVEQLLEIMPELRDVSAWHTVGQRRTLDDYGRIVERQMSDDLLRRLPR